MAISLAKYVSITSGVGGATIVPIRELIGRLFTTNPLVPTKTVLEFTSSADVGLYFGTTSVEYLRALFYFGWVSKSLNRARKLSFSFWANAATVPLIYGTAGPQTLANYTTISNGALTLNIGGVSNVLTGIVLTGSASLAAVASTIQTKIRTLTGTQYTAATVTYDPVAQRFIFTGGLAGAATISTTPAGTGTDLAPLLGWVSGAVGPIFSNGTTIETITQTLQQSSDISNNFGSFAFVPTLTLSQVTEAATWNDALNVYFQYMVPVAVADASAWSAALVGIGGVGLTLSPLSTEYPEMVPMMILAATNYAKANATQNYMYQQFNLTPSVSTTADSNTYDALRINYYGSTQTAGQILSFYQRGFLMGNSADPVDMNTYANEQWLKDDAGSKIMNMLLTLREIPANTTGISQLLSTIQSTIDQALINGSISVGKTLTTNQKQYIGDISGDDNAWQQIQTIGYYRNCVIVPYQNTANVTEYRAVYSLIYSKDDTVRQVIGTHTLI